MSQVAPQVVDNFSVVPPTATPWNKYPLNTHSLDQVYQCLQENGSILGYDLNRLAFTEPKLEPVKSADGKVMTAYRIQIKDRRPDGKLQDLIFTLKESYCFGVSINTDMQNKDKLTGYQVGLPMWSQHGVTEDEKYLTDLLEYWIVDRILDHLITIKDKILLSDKDKRDLRNLKIFNRPKDEQKRVKKDAAPIWNPKLFTNKEKGHAIKTKFYWKGVVDQDGCPMEVDPLVFLKKGFKAIPSIKIDSIYISAKSEVYVMCKVWEIDCSPAGDMLTRIGKVDKDNALSFDAIKEDPKYAAYLKKPSLTDLPPMDVATTGENPLNAPLGSAPLGSAPLGSAPLGAPVENKEFAAPPMMPQQPQTNPPMMPLPSTQIGLPQLPQMSAPASMPQLPQLPQMGAAKVHTLNPGMVPQFPPR